MQGEGYGNTKGRACFFLTLPLTSGKGTLSSLSILTDVNLVWRFSVCEGAWWRGECESECECVE